MLVSQILGMKGGRDVITVGEDASIKDVIQILSEKRIGAILITGADGTPSGILSERDIVRELGRRGESCLGDNAADMMTRSLISCSPEDTADAVLGKMTDGRFRHMPVLVDGQLAGLISIGDVVKARLSELAMEKDALEGMIKGF